MDLNWDRHRKVNGDPIAIPCLLLSISATYTRLFLTLHRQSCCSQVATVPTQRPYLSTTAKAPLALPHRRLRLAAQKVRCNQRLDSISLLATSIGWDGRHESDSEDEPRRSRRLNLRWNISLHSPIAKWALYKHLGLCCPSSLGLLIGFIPVCLLQSLIPFASSPFHDTILSLEWAALGLSFFINTPSFPNMLSFRGNLLQQCIQSGGEPLSQDRYRTSVMATAILRTTARMNRSRRPFMADLRLSPHGHIGVRHPSMRRWDRLWRSP